jgi:hypothetical protein
MVDVDDGVGRIVNRLAPGPICLDASEGLRSDRTSRGYAILRASPYCGAGSGNSKTTFQKRAFISAREDFFSGAFPTWTA